MSEGCRSNCDNILASPYFSSNPRATDVIQIKTGIANVNVKMVTSQNISET